MPGPGSWRPERPGRDGVQAPRLLSIDLTPMRTIYDENGHPLIPDRADDPAIGHKVS